MFSRPGADTLVLYRMHAKSSAHFQMRVMAARLMNLPRWAWVAVNKFAARAQPQSYNLQSGSDPHQLQAAHFYLCSVRSILSLGSRCVVAKQGASSPLGIRAGGVRLRGCTLGL